MRKNDYFGTSFITSLICFLSLSILMINCSDITSTQPENEHRVSAAASKSKKLSIDIFKEVILTRTTGAPNTLSFNLELDEIPNGINQITMEVCDISMNSNKDKNKKVASAVVAWNEEIILDPSDFKLKNGDCTTKKFNIGLTPAEFFAEIRSAPGTALKFSFSFSRSGENPPDNPPPFPNPIEFCDISQAETDNTSIRIPGYVSTGIVSGDVSLQSGSEGSSLRFSENEGRLTYNDPDGLLGPGDSGGGAYSFYGYFSPSQPDTYTVLQDKGHSASEDLGICLILLQDGRISLLIGSEEYTTTRPIQFNVRNGIGYTISNGYLFFYLNDELIDTIAIQPVEKNAEPLIIGARAGSPGYIGDFGGFIILNRSITPEDLEVLWESDVELPEPILHWPFTSSGIELINGFNANLVNTSFEQGPGGIINGAVNFIVDDESYGIATIGAVLENQESGSISFFAKPTGEEGVLIGYNRRQDAGSEFVINVADNTLGVYFYANGIRIEGYQDDEAPDFVPFFENENEWVHITVVGNGTGTPQVYRNGQLFPLTWENNTEEEIIWFNLITDIPEFMGLYFGVNTADVFFPQELFDGAMADIQFFDIPLSEGQIAEICRSGGVCE